MRRSREAPGKGAALGIPARRGELGALTTLHSFARSDGAGPRARLTPGEGGSFYGTIGGGGAYNRGTIFKFDSAGVLTTLHSFRGSRLRKKLKPYEVARDERSLRVVKECKGALSNRWIPSVR